MPVVEYIYESTILQTCDIMSVDNPKKKSRSSDSAFGKLPIEVQQEIFAELPCFEKHVLCLTNRDMKKLCVSNKDEGYDTSNRAYLKCTSEIDEQIYQIKKNLLNAVKSNDLTGVEVLLGIRARDTSRDTSTGWGEVIDVNFSLEGETMLMVAIEKGYKEIVERLLQVRGIDVNRQVTYEHTISALMYASEIGKKDIVELLLKQPRINPNLEDFHGNTALFLAINNNREEVVNVLLDNGKHGFQINLNHQNRDGHTALMLAILEPHRGHIVQALLKKDNVDLNLQNKAGETALMLAANQYPVNVDMANMLVEARIRHIKKHKANLQNLKGQTELMAVSNVTDHENFVKALLSTENGLKVNVNLQDSKGWTALMYAISENRDGMVNEFLRYGKFTTPHIDVNLISTSWRYETALTLAIKRENQPNVERLLAFETIDINLALTRFGNFALMNACSVNDGPANVAIVKKLLTARNIDVKKQDYGGKTALIIALELRRNNIANELLENDDIRATVNIQDNMGFTAIMYAVLQQGETAHTAGRDGPTAIHMVKKLLDINGIQLRLRNKHGFTALMYAQKLKVVDGGRSVRSVVDVDVVLYLLKKALNENEERLTELRAIGMSVYM